MTMTDAFQRIQDYDWQSDADYMKLHQVMQQQLGAEVAGTPQVEAQSRVMLAQKKWGLNINLDEYCDWILSNTSIRADEKTGENYPSKYQHIVDLIMQGKPIPGVKQIPDTVLGHEASSRSDIGQRKKPWES